MPILVFILDSMLFKKKEISYSSIGNKITEEDGLCGRVLRATTEQEAFGLAYDTHRK